MISADEDDEEEELAKASSCCRGRGGLLFAVVPSTMSLNNIFHWLSIQMAVL